MKYFTFKKEVKSSKKKKLSIFETKNNVIEIN